MPSIEVTNGIKIEVQTLYLNDYSRPKDGRYLFCYRVIMTNESDKWVKLVSRHWVILDKDSNKQEVQGKGVIGKQPELDPGQSHEYFSFSNLETDFGTMEGTYQFVDEDANEFDVAIPRFYLATNLKEFEGNLFHRGEIVHHKRYDYDAVIVDFDMYFLNDEEWYESNKTQPPKNKPWYYVLAHGSDTVHYVAQENLEQRDSKAEIVNPLTNFFFDDFDGEKYHRNEKTWQDLKKT